METILYPKRQVIISEGAIYRLHIHQNTNRNTGAVESYNLNLGGKTRKCFNMIIPGVQSNKTDGFLSWVEAHDECSFERFLTKKAIQHMILLGISIARSMNPNLKKIYFDDVSNITCTFPDGREQKVPMKPFHLAFHQATWYEYYFDAKLVKDYDAYVALKANFRDPSKKPSTFDFKHPDLQMKLEPLYAQSETWEEFFTDITSMYKDKKCTVLYPWLNDALYIIFENNPYFESVKWYIDLEENTRKNKTASVYFESYEDKQEGGRRKTRKQMQQTSTRTYLYPNRPEVERWNYNTFLL
jgi:hypothetical protein